MNEIWIIGKGTTEEKIKRNELFIIKIKLNGDNPTNKLHIKHLRMEIEILKELLEKNKK